MSCYRPVQAYRSLSKLTPEGKQFICFNVREAGFKYEFIDLPCGKCIGCQLDRSRDWALRCVHEASLYSENCFITLTFSSDKLNESGSLVKKDFQLFMKRLRKRFDGVDYVQKDGVLIKPIRYFHCGEYGASFDRPHHHACLFNFDFPDKTLWSVRQGVRLYRSEILESLWQNGYCTIGDVTFESAAYVARYCTKKFYGDDAKRNYKRVDKVSGEVYEILPEYISMSRRPGIGRNWFEAFSSDMYPKDFVTLDGKKFAAPRYYDKIYDTVSPCDFKSLKKRRIEKALLNASDNTPRRRLVKEVCKERQKQKLIRSYENEVENVLLV